MLKTSRIDWNTDTTNMFLLYVTNSEGHLQTALTSVPVLLSLLYPWVSAIILCHCMEGFFFLPRGWAVTAALQLGWMELHEKCSISVLSELRSRSHCSRSSLNTLYIWQTHRGLSHALYSKWPPSCCSTRRAWLMECGQNGHPFMMTFHSYTRPS